MARFLLWCFTVCFAGGFSTILPNVTSSTSSLGTETSSQDQNQSTTSQMTTLSAVPSTSSLTSNPTTEPITTTTGSTPDLKVSMGSTTTWLVTSSANSESSTSPEPSPSSVTSTTTPIPPPDLQIPCPPGSVNRFGTLGPGPSGACTNDYDCRNVGLARNETLRLHVTCVFNEKETASRCCFKDTSTYCQFGVSVLPEQRCRTLDDCNLKIGFTTQRWCDSKSKMCCRHPNGEFPLLCPDGFTALMNEQPCTGVFKENEHSGTCPQPNGMCFHGHCCPIGAKRGIRTPGPPYQTRIKCTNSTIIEIMHGYCDPETGRIWIMGHDNMHGQNVLNFTTLCQTTRDCGRALGRDAVCVRVKSNLSHCFMNPRVKNEPLEKPSLMLISIASYTALATAVLALIASILYKRIRKIDVEVLGAADENQELISDK